MKRILRLFDAFETEYVEPYKSSWIKAKLKRQDDLRAVAEALKEEGLRSLVTVSPTDFPDESRMEMNYFFEDLQTKRNCWLKCDIPRTPDQCRIDSLTPLFAGADWSEREAFSMFGVDFADHPDLRPIIVSQDFYGKAPFRKDFDWEAHEADTLNHLKTIVNDFEKEQQNSDANLDPDGSETVLNWGPTHPASGPIRLKVHCDGEEVIGIDPDIGYVWRALEHLVTQKDFIGAIVAVERLCFMDNINSMVGYCMAVEEIAEIQITPFA
ncbi:MAG TPA: NADH-quinone oxidoreductase subunit D, partial [Sulfuricurvum sp.]|nr:NADH-quinone oxidoreductase subunit D [Sulfuricurvum sp.]